MEQRQRQRQWQKIKDKRGKYTGGVKCVMKKGLLL